MKTTLQIPDELFRQAKAKGALEGLKLQDIVAEGLRLVLAPKSSPSRRRRVKLPLMECGEPGSLQITDAMLDEHEMMEDRERYKASMRYY